MTRTGIVRTCIVVLALLMLLSAPCTASGVDTEIYISVDNRMQGNPAQDAPNGDTFTVTGYDYRGRTIGTVQGNGVLAGKLSELGLKGAVRLVITSEATKGVDTRSQCSTGLLLTNNMAATVYLRGRNQVFYFLTFYK